MRPTIHLRQSSIAADTATTARISTASSDANDALLRGDLDMMLSAHDMFDSSARTFAEQRDQVIAQDVGFPPHGSHVDDSDVVARSLWGGDGGDLEPSDEMIGADMASLGWGDLNQ